MRAGGVCGGGRALGDGDGFGLQSGTLNGAAFITELEFSAIGRIDGIDLNGDFRAAADSLMMSVSEINRSELRALAAASQLE